MTVIQSNPFDDDQIHEKMIEILPELDSEYFRNVPLDWNEPQDVFGSTPCFIMHPGQSSEVHRIPIKRDYIWIPGDVDEELLGGYYHLSTKEAHREDLRRINLHDKERKNSTLSNVIKLKIRSKDEKEDDKLTRKVLQILKSRLKESSSESRSDVIQKRRNSKAEERRRSSLRNSAATIASDISLMGY